MQRKCPGSRHRPGLPARPRAPPLEACWGFPLCLQRQKGAVPAVEVRVPQGSKEADQAGRAGDKAVSDQRGKELVSVLSRKRVCRGDSLL